MKNDDLKELIDGLYIKTALQEVHIQQLTSFVLDLMHRLEGLNKQTTVRKIEFLESMQSLSTSELDDLGQFLDNPKQILRSKMESHQTFESLIEMLKQELNDLKS